MQRITTSHSIQAIKGFLTTYQRSGEHKSWDVFREKIPAPILEAWGLILSECRRNGYVGPVVKGGDFTDKQFMGGKIVFQQILTTSDKPLDQCTLCERECLRRDEIGSGEAKRMHGKNKAPGVKIYEERRPCYDQGQS